MLKIWTVGAAGGNFRENCHVTSCISSTSKWKGFDIPQSWEVCNIAVTDLPKKLKLHNNDFVHLQHKPIFFQCDQLAQFNKAVTQKGWKVKVYYYYPVVIIKLALIAL